MLTVLVAAVLLAGATSLTVLICQAYQGRQRQLQIRARRLAAEQRLDRLTYDTLARMRDVSRHYYGNRSA